MSTLAKPMCTVSLSVVAGTVLLSIGGSKLLPLALSCAAAPRTADPGGCAGGAGSAAALLGGSGGLGNLCADGGRALSGTSTALPDDAAISAGVVVPLISSCSSVL